MSPHQIKFLIYLGLSKGSDLALFAEDNITLDIMVIYVSFSL